MRGLTSNYLKSLGWVIGQNQKGRDLLFFNTVKWFLSFIQHSKQIQSENIRSYDNHNRFAIVPWSLLRKYKVRRWRIRESVQSLESVGPKSVFLSVESLLISYSRGRAHDSHPVSDLYVIQLKLKSMQADNGNMIVHVNYVTYRFLSVTDLHWLLFLEMGPLQLAVLERAKWLHAAQFIIWSASFQSVN